VPHSSNTLLWMGNGFMLLTQLAGASHRLFTLSSQGRIQQTHMVKYWKYFDLIKTFVRLAIRCGLLDWDGLSLGQASMKNYGMNCTSFTQYSRIFSCSNGQDHNQVKLLTYSFGSLENTKHLILMFLSWLIWTGYKDSLSLPSFLSVRTRWKSGRRWIYQRWTTLFCIWCIHTHVHYF